MPKTVFVAHENPHSSYLASGGPLSQGKQAGWKRRLQDAEDVALLSIESSLFISNLCVPFISEKRGWIEAEADLCVPLFMGKKGYREAEVAG